MPRCVKDLLNNLLVTAVVVSDDVIAAEVRKRQCFGMALSLAVAAGYGGGSGCSWQRAAAVVIVSMEVRVWLLGCSFDSASTSLLVGFRRGMA